ncbi:hypothetical protein GGX14DRAFT_658057 [Mycena pura]|uniref:Uncharacterized protein n=1 Tax=Mycena pura TaxID=153505 RepID=A0AAD7E1C5_9AGAR|nr:hypothetical protein GGX14DRAFT_658057 [Mycena pura]
MTDRPQITSTRYDLDKQGGMVQLVYSDIPERKHSHAVAADAKPIFRHVVPPSIDRPYGLPKHLCYCKHISHALISSGAKGMIYSQLTSESTCFKVIGTTYMRQSTSKPRQRCKMRRKATAGRDAWCPAQAADVRDSLSGKSQYTNRTMTRQASTDLSRFQPKAHKGSGNFTFLKAPVTKVEPSTDTKIAKFLRQDRHLY